MLTFALLALVLALPLAERQGRAVLARRLAEFTREAR